MSELTTGEWWELAAELASTLLLVVLIVRVGRRHGRKIDNVDRRMAAHESTTEGWRTQLQQKVLHLWTRCDAKIFGPKDREGDR